MSDQNPDGPGVLRYLSAADVQRCLPPLERRLELAEAALVSLARGEAQSRPSQCSNAVVLVMAASGMYTVDQDR